MFEYRLGATRLRLSGPDSWLDLAIAEKGALSFAGRQGPGAQPVIVITTPKAGTYLVGKILAELGLTDLEVHLGMDGFSDYRGRSKQEKIERTRHLAISLPIELTSRLVLPGQFAVGHIPYVPRAIPLFEDFVRIVAVREVRASLTSMMRFEYLRLVADPGRALLKRSWISRPDGPERMLAFLEAMGADFLAVLRAVHPWRAHPGCIVLRFEQLLGDDGRESQLQAVAAIANRAGVEADTAKTLERALGADTLTYSGARSNVATYWSGEAEQIFQTLGGEDLNNAFGYSGDLASVRG
jgi:hypothetical protein